MKGNNASKVKKNVVIVAIALLLLIVTIGYAALTTTLNISGTANISTVGWDVHFANVKVSSGSVSASTPAAINGATTAINYAVTLNKPGEFYEFTVDVVNAGTLDAKLSDVTLGGLTQEYDVYINYNVTYADGEAIEKNDILAAGSSKTLKVRVEFDNTISANQLPTTTNGLSLTIATTYVQA